MSVGAFEVLREVAERTGKPYEAAKRLADRLNRGVDMDEAASVVARLLEGGNRVSDSDDPIGTALEGIAEKRQEVENELATMDSRKAALRDQLKQLTAAEKSLRNIAGKPRLVGQMFTCPECGKEVPSERGLATHKSRMHPAA